MMDNEPRCAWKKRAYLAPSLGPRGFRWKASAGRAVRRWSQDRRIPGPSTIVVPALYNRLPAETVAMGWLNEIDALHNIRPRMMAVAQKTGWDVFTFHTQHNLDQFFDSTIDAMRDTWSNEGSLSREAVVETRRRFGNADDYYRIQPRLVENLVFQSALIEWTACHAEDVALQFRIIGTALYSALVAFGAVSFEDAMVSALRVGARWDAAIQSMAEGQATKSVASATEIGRRRFEIIDRVMEGSEELSLAATAKDLCRADAPSRPFWFSATAADEPVRIETARDAALALEALNLNSWLPGQVRTTDNSFRGWLVSPLHAMAKVCH